MRIFHFLRICFLFFCFFLLIFLILANLKNPSPSPFIINCETRIFNSFQIFWISFNNRKYGLLFYFKKRPVQISFHHFNVLVCFLFQLSTVRDAWLDPCHCGHNVCKLPDRLIWLIERDSPAWIVFLCFILLVLKFSIVDVLI